MFFFFYTFIQLIFWKSPKFSIFRPTFTLVEQTNNSFFFSFLEPTIHKTLTLKPKPNYFQKIQGRFSPILRAYMPGIDQDIVQHKIPPYPDAYS